MDTILGMIIGALALVVGQMVSALLGPWFVVPINQRNARRRFAGEPLIHVGARLLEIRQGGSDKPVCGPCVITSIAVGRIEVAPVNNVTEWRPTDRRMFWTLAEFEGFDPVVQT